MTEVLFYTHAEDKRQTACTLTVKALSRGMRVMLLTADPASTDQLSRLIWSVPPTGFVPHCRSSDRLAAVTPVIVDHLAEALPHDQVLINLCDQTPAFFSRFQRLVEIVGTEEADREAARTRFRFYRDRGYEIRTHQLGKTES
ncbi:MAG: DNA polymerase III subunit chi [Betaproteobacteria bacterium]